MTDSATIGSLDTIALDFAGSQRAGQAAMSRLARADATGGPPPVARSGAPRPEVPASPRGLAANSGSARPVPAVALWSQEIDRPRAAVRPAPVTADRLPATEGQLNRERRAIWNNHSLLLLIAILTIQAVLSLRLVWSNTAFLDEAIYISAGHVEIAHWLHGTPVPAYATYFSGAPVIYPPIAAIADSIGGLAAARILSLVFMLGVTSLLWSLTSRLFGKRAAVCAAILFAILGPTLRLGAFATFDAMALFLLATSAWCMVSSQDRDDSALLLLAGTVLLALANATKYSTMLFDPPVVALAGLAIAGKHGVKAAVARSGCVATGCLGLISALLALGGPWYLAGVLYTTVSRSPGAARLDWYSPTRGNGLDWSA